MKNIDTLIEQFRHKDEKAFEKLYYLYSRNTHIFINNIVRNKDLADELVQDTFLKAWQNAHKFTPDKGRFFTWILNIARNASIDLLRSKAHKQLQITTDVDARYDLGCTRDHEKSTNANYVSRFLPRLSASRCEVIDLLFLQEYTHKEAAEYLNIPLGTLKHRSREGLSDLRQLMHL